MACTLPDNVWSLHRIVAVDVALARPSSGGGPRVGCSFLVVTIFSDLKLKFQNKLRESGLFSFPGARGTGRHRAARRRARDGRRPSPKPVASVARVDRLARWSSFAEAELGEMREEASRRRNQGSARPRVCARRQRSALAAWSPTAAVDAAASLAAR